MQGQTVNTNSSAYGVLIDSDLAFIAPQLQPKQSESHWIRIGSALAAGAIFAGIWFYKIAPDDQSPAKLLVEPAEDVLSSFVQPAVSMSSLSKDVGFQVSVPNLKAIGANLKTVGESDFAGHRAAVMQFEHNGYQFLMYSVRSAGALLSQMRSVSSPHGPLFVVSSGAVSVVAWNDPKAGCRAIAAQSTEQDLIALAIKVSEAS